MSARLKDERTIMLREANAVLESTKEKVNFGFSPLTLAWVKY